MGLSPQMPAHAGRMSDAEIEAVVAHLASFADTRGYPPGELNFTRAVRTIKAFPETELLLLGRYEEPATARRPPGAARSTTRGAWGAAGRREAKLSHLSQGTTSELHEAELGVKWAFHDRGTRLLLAAGTDVEIPLQAAGDTHVRAVPLARDAAGRAVHACRARCGRTCRASGLARRRRGALRGRPLAAHEMAARHLPGPRADGGRARSRAEDRWRVSLIPQLHLALSKRGHVAFNVGRRGAPGRRAGRLPLPPPHVPALGHGRRRLLAGLVDAHAARIAERAPTP